MNSDINPKMRGEKKETAPRHDQTNGKDRRTSESRKVHKRQDRQMHHSRRTQNRSIMTRGDIEGIEALVGNIHRDWKY